MLKTKKEDFAKLNTPECPDLAVVWSKRLIGFTIRAMNSFDINLATLEVTKYSRQVRLQKFMKRLDLIFGEVSITAEELNGMSGF